MREHSGHVVESNPTGKNDYSWAKKSRRVSEFYKDYESDGGEFIPLREEPLDPRAVSLKGQLDELNKLYKKKSHRLATLDEALRVQVLIEVSYYQGEDRIIK